MRYLLISENSKIDFFNDRISCILYLIDCYKQKKDPQILTFISYLIELFYNELALKNTANLNLYFINKFNLLKLIDNTKKFNLDKQNLFITLKERIKNDAK